MGPSQATVLTGTRDVATFSTETRRSRDVLPALQQLEPDAGPLVTITSKVRKKAATDPKIEWFEDQLLPRFDALTADCAANATTMTVSNPSYFRAGDIVRIAKNELVRVTTTPAAGATTVAITRGVGEVAATAAVTGDQVHIIGNSNQEGATARSLLTTQRVPQYNYLQIIRDPFALTNTAIATTTFAGQDWTEEQMKQLIEHKKHIELSFIVGQRAEDTTGTHPQRLTRGLEKWISSFATDVSGPMTEQVFDGILRTGFRYGKKTKLCIASPIVMQSINGFAKGKLRVVDKAKSYGISLQSYENAGRTVLLFEHELMTNLDLNDFSGIGGEALILDMDDVVARYIKGRYGQHNMNIQAPDEDSRKDEYLSEVGLETHLEAKHAKAFNITG